MPSIEHSRGNVSLKRSGSMQPRWDFTVFGESSEQTQTFFLTDQQDIEDLKAIIGQVEHAYKVLSGEREK